MFKAALTLMTAVAMTACVADSDPTENDDCATLCAGEKDKLAHDCIHRPREP